MLSEVWNQLVDYIDKREPGYAQTVRGANKDELQAIRETHKVELPLAYSSLLSSIGEDPSGFRVVPKHYHFVIDDLLAIATEVGGGNHFYSRNDYLPVGFEFEDRDEIEGDICLDLRYGDPDNPPVVLVDAAGASERPSIMELDTSFTTYVQERAFSQYELLRRGFAMWLSTPDADSECPKRWAELLYTSWSVSDSPRSSRADHASGSAAAMALPLRPGDRPDCLWLIW